MKEVTCRSILLGKDNGVKQVSWEKKTRNDAGYNKSSRNYNSPSFDRKIKEEGKTKQNWKIGGQYRVVNSKDLIGNPYADAIEHKECKLCFLVLQFPIEIKCNYCEANHTARKYNRKPLVVENTVKDVKDIGDQWN